MKGRHRHVFLPAYEITIQVTKDPYILTRVSTNSRSSILWCKKSTEMTYAIMDRKKTKKKIKVFIRL